ncbi:MAG: hypothetical protein HYV03_02170 [Deltaproteobacteria bacterium]|nr:hypothetical protein [Deltaproteobacteria bacterium]
MQPIRPIMMGSLFLISMAWSSAGWARSNTVPDGDIAELVAEAKARSLRFDNAGALAVAKEAVRQAEAMRGTTKLAEARLGEALLTLAMAHHAMRDAAGVKSVADRFAAVAPNVPVDTVEYPPSVVSAIAMARAANGVGAPGLTTAPETAPAVSDVQRDRRRTVSPIVWGAVGVGVVGGIVAALFAGHGGEAPTTGAVAVSFR